MSTECIIIVVSDTLERSWPTNPALWNVEPLVSSARSTSTTSRSPSWARCHAIEAPPTPPPMMTIRARSGSSRGRTIEPLLPVGLEHLAEPVARVGGEVVVEVGEHLLDDAPHPLAVLRRGAVQPQPGELGLVAVAEVRGQQLGVVVHLERVHRREVAEVEERVAHAGVLPVDEPQPVAVVEQVGRQQVVVAQRGLERRRRPLDAPRRGDGLVTTLRQPAAALERDLAVALADAE